MIIRYCSHCGQEKAIEEFARNKSKPLGYDYLCKSCCLIRDKKRAKAPEKIAQVARWHQSEYGKMKARISRAKRFALHKEKYQAKEIIERLVNKGIIQRLPCVECGEKNSQGHHPDYSKPLKVVWLCQAHHSEEHNRLRQLTPPE